MWFIFLWSFSERHPIDIMHHAGVRIPVGCLRWTHDTHQQPTPIQKAGRKRSAKTCRSNAISDWCPSSSLKLSPSVSHTCWAWQKKILPDCLSNVHKKKVCAMLCSSSFGYTRKGNKTLRSDKVQWRPSEIYCRINPIIQEEGIEGRWEDRQETKKKKRENTLVAPLPPWRPGWSVKVRALNFMYLRSAVTKVLIPTSTI